MYNGIGVTSVRGTGTSGYVQTNKFNLRHRPGPKEFSQEALAQPQVSQQPNKGIIEHNKKRELEIQLMRERDRLEDAGEFSAAEVEQKLAAFRDGLLEESAVQQREKAVNVAASERTEKETHWLAEQKQQELARVRDAWGLGDIVEGEAFNRDIQEAKKQARIAQREKDKQDREDRKQREQEARQKAAKDAEKRRKQMEAERQKAEEEAVQRRQQQADARAARMAVPAEERYVPRPASPGLERSPSPSPSPSRARQSHRPPAPVQPSHPQILPSGGSPEALEASPDPPRRAAGKHAREEGPADRDRGDDRRTRQRREEASRGQAERGQARSASHREDRAAPAEVDRSRRQHDGRDARDRQASGSRHESRGGRHRDEDEARHAVRSRADERSRLPQEDRHRSNGHAPSSRIDDRRSSRDERRLSPDRRKSSEGRRQRRSPTPSSSSGGSSSSSGDASSSSGSSTSGSSSSSGSDSDSR